MPLREELILKRPSDAWIQEIQGMGQDIIDGIDAGQDVSSQIETLQKKIGRHNYGLDYFRTLYSRSSIEEFAEKATLPVPRRVSEVTRDELIEIVRLALTDGPNSTYYLELFEINAPMSGASDLIYWPETDDPSPEEIVDKALSPDNVIHL